MECIEGENILTLFQGSRKKICTGARLRFGQPLADGYRSFLVVGGGIGNARNFNGPQTGQVLPIGVGQTTGDSWPLTSDSFPERLNEAAGTLFFYVQEGR